jgi:hypothetical protein
LEKSKKKTKKQKQIIMRLRKGMSRIRGSLTDSPIGRKTKDWRTEYKRRKKKK